MKTSAFSVGFKGSIDVNREVSSEKKAEIVAKIAVAVRSALEQGAASGIGSVRVDGIAETFTAIAA